MPLLLTAMLAASCLPAPCLGTVADAVADKRADADASADPSASSSFFDTFMAFLGSSALHQQQQPDDGAEAGRDAVEAAASDADEQQQPLPFQGRDLHDQYLAGAPLQDGGQADRVKRTGALPAQLLGGVINHKLGYLGAKSSHHVHFHNYGTKVGASLSYPGPCHVAQGFACFLVAHDVNQCLISTCAEFSRQM